MNNERVLVGPYEVNCSILWEDPAQAWVIDPGADAEDILGVMRRKGLRAGVVVLTHGHFDHVSAVNDVAAAFAAPVYLHKADAAFAFLPINAMPPYYPPTARPVTLKTDKGDGDTLSCGGLTAKLIHTPGHTPGGWCLYFEREKLLLAGDTLFAGSVGRTDFPGGSWEALEASLRRLTALPDDTRVVCGHGPTTTIGAEKNHNPYLADLRG